MNTEIEKHPIMAERDCARSVSRSGWNISLAFEPAAAGPLDTAALQNRGIHEH
jgi:hypothetical protein